VNCGARRKRAGVSDLRADLTEVGGYLDLVYADSAGFSICGFGRPVLLAGRYRHDLFRQRSYRLPQRRQHLLDDVSAAVARGEDVFITPLLRDAPSRALDKSQPLPARWVWLDVDDWSQDLERDLIELGLPCHLVDSGGIGDRRHAYVDLGRVLPGLQVADYARRLANTLSTDTSGGNNKFLRPPGTFNHKARLLGGGQPRLVRRLDTLNPLADADHAALDLPGRTGTQQEHRAAVQAGWQEPGEPAAVGRAAGRSATVPGGAAHRGCVPQVPLHKTSATSLCSPPCFGCFAPASRDIPGCFTSYPVCALTSSAPCTAAD